MKVLVIDDDTGCRELLIRRLQTELPDPEFIEIDHRTKLEAAIAQADFELVLTEYRLNWTDGLWILRFIKEKLPEVPVLMLTDSGSETIAVEGMKAGLSDYLVKSRLDRLPLAVKESLEKARLRKEHENALRQLKISEERNRTVSGLCSDYAYAFSVSSEGAWAHEWMSQDFERITGYRPGELDERGDWLAVVYPEDRDILLDRRDRLLAGQTVISEFRVVTKGGEVRWLRDYARAVRNSQQGRVTRIVGAGQDITGHKREEEERTRLLREQVAGAEAEASEQRYQLLAEAIPQIVWTARADGWLDYYNKRWYDYTGLTFEQTQGWGWQLAVHPDDLQKCVQRWKNAIETGEGYEIEYRFKRASDGSYRWHLGRGLALRDATGRIVKWFGTCTDIDDQKRAEESLRQSEKLAGIGLLAGGVAHDFNNLLTGIMGNASLALDSLREGDPARPLLEDVVRATERAADLTRQLLAYSGKGRFVVKPLDLSELIREVSSLIRTFIPRNAEFILELKSKLPLAEMDSSQIQQLVMNLVINASEAIGEGTGGTVRVRTGMADVDAEYLRTSFPTGELPAGRYVWLEVQDTGCGMDEATKSQIFDPFFTTKFMGRGLGLAAALGIVRGHKGGLKVESAPGQGSTFQVFLPAVDSTIPQRKAAPLRKNLQGSGIILVVDDEEVVRTTAKATLQRYGYKVLLAGNGAVAREMFERMTEYISLVLLDMSMPVMNGEETLVHLKRIQPNIPVIASSGYSEQVAIQRFAGTGLAHFIQKPYTAAELADKVKDALQNVIKTGNAAPIGTHAADLLK